MACHIKHGPAVRVCCCCGSESSLDGCARWWLSERVRLWCSMQKACSSQVWRAMVIGTMAHATQAMRASRGWIFGHSGRLNLIFPSPTLHSTANALGPEAPLISGDLLSRPSGSSRPRPFRLNCERRIPLPLVGIAVPDETAQFG